MTSLTEHSIADKCLLIDSSHQSRQELLRAVKSIGLVDQVVEAKSLGGAITQLTQDDIEICLLGPALRIPTAAKFATEAVKAIGTRSCIVVAIARAGADIQALHDVGIDGVLEEPYTKKELSEFLVSVLRENSDGLSRRIKSEDSSTITIIGDTRTNHQSLSVRLDKSLADVLDDVGFKLNQLANNAKRGKNVNADGTPSPVLLDKVRLALEPLFPDQEAAARIGTSEHNYLSAVVQWLENRSRMDDKEAITLLSRKLTALKPNS